MKIQFIPTGNVFDLPKEVVEEILAESKDEYKVLDKNYKKDVKKPVKTTTYDKVVKG